MALAPRVACGVRVYDPANAVGFHREGAAVAPEWRAKSEGVFLAIARFGRLESTGLLPTAGLPSAVAVEGVVTLSTVVQGLFNGVAQVFFQGNS